MRRHALAALTALALSACSADPAPNAAAASPATGAARPAKAGLCVACHGDNGASRAPGTPSIGGQDPIYLRKALADYREGRRNGGPMNAAAGGLSDGDIEALAAWYAAQRWPAAAEGAP